MANSCEHRIPPLMLHHAIVLVVIACSTPTRDHSFDDPAAAATLVRNAVISCDGVTRILDQLARARVTGRLLAGLVDDAIAHARCADPGAAIKGRRAPHQLARARLSDDRPDDALAQLTSLAEPAIRYRRAELLDRLGRAGDALRELDAIALDADAAALQRLLRVSVAARAGKHDEIARVIEAAPLPDRPRLAHRAVADAAAQTLAGLATSTSLELAVAAAERLEELHGPAAVVAVRERIAAAEPSIAEHWDALGRARIAAADTDGALAAWDRATDIAPAQPAFRLAPIRALVIAGQPALARERATALANAARASNDVELLVTASAGAAAASDRTLAVELARDARAKRTSDGRLGFIVAQRLAEAGDVRGAADAYAELLVCGAHGRPWHRHEVAGKLLALGRDSSAARALVLAAVAAKRTCAPVEPDDLATYVAGLTGP